MMAMTRLLRAGCLLMAVGAAHAQDLPFMRLAVAAIDSPDGVAREKFGQNLAWVQAMRRQLQMPGPVTVTARVTHRFQQEGCARIQDLFTLHEARLVAGKLEDVEFSVNFNTCRDGQPPLESLDVQEIQRLTSPPTDSTPKPPGMPLVVPLDRPNQGSAAEPMSPRRR